MDYISHQLGLLEIINRIPDIGVQPDGLVNRTVDVFSASLMYLAVHIRHESNRLGVLGTMPIQKHTNLVGSIAITIFSGEEALISVEVRLRNAVEEYNSTLAHFSHGVGFRSFGLVSQTLDAVQG